MTAHGLSMEVFQSLTSHMETNMAGMNQVRKNELGKPLIYLPLHVVAETFEKVLKN